MSGIWEMHTALVTMILFCSTIFLQNKKLGWPLTLTWAYCVALCTILTFWPGMLMIPGVPKQFTANLKITTVESLVLFSIPLIISFPKVWRLKAAETIAWIAIINAPVAKYFGGGIFNVASFDLTITAIAASYFAYRNMMLPAILGTIITLLFGGSTAWITLFAGSTVYLWLYQKRFRWVPILSALAVLATFRTASFNTRVALWKESFDWWFKYATTWIGIGPGGFQIMGAFSKYSTGENPLWMHNDFLQFIIEYGYIGLTLMLLCFWWMFRNIKGDIWIPIAAIVAGGMGYFPMHFTLSQIFCVLIVYEGIENGREKAPTFC